MRFLSWLQSHGSWKFAGRTKIPRALTERGIYSPGLPRTTHGAARRLGTSLQLTWAQDRGFRETEQQWVIRAVSWCAHSPGRTACLKRNRISNFAVPDSPGPHLPYSPPRCPTGPDDCSLPCRFLVTLWMETQSGVILECRRRCRIFHRNTLPTDPVCWRA